MSPLFLEDHQLSLVYVLGDAEGAIDVGQTLAALDEAGEGPIPATKHLADKVGDEPVWVPNSVEGVSELPGRSYPQSIDLSQPVRDLLACKRSGLLQMYKLNPNLQHLLRFGDLPAKLRVDLQKSMICLQASKSAQERLAKVGMDAVPLWINPTRVELMVFSTGASLVHVDIELMRVGASSKTQLSVPELQEAVHALSRFNKCTWFDRSTGTALNKGSFAFGAMIQRLLRQTIPDATTFTRVPTFTYASLRDHVPP